MLPLHAAADHHHSPLRSPPTGGASPGGTTSAPPAHGGTAALSFYLFFDFFGYEFFSRPAPFAGLLFCGGGFGRCRAASGAGGGGTFCSGYRRLGKVRAGPLGGFCDMAAAVVVSGILRQQ